MSVHYNQYIMYAIRLPYSNEAYDKMEPFMDNPNEHTDGIFVLYDGMSGKYIFVGRVLDMSATDDVLGADPICLSDITLTALEKEYIQNSVKRNLGIEGEFKNYFITMYR